MTSTESGGVSPGSQTWIDSSSESIENMHGGTATLNATCRSFWSQYKPHAIRDIRLHSFLVPSVPHDIRLHSFGTFLWSIRAQSEVPRRAAWDPLACISTYAYHRVRVCASVGVDVCSYTTWCDGIDDSRVSVQVPRACA